MKKFFILILFMCICVLFLTNPLFAQKGDTLAKGKNRLNNGDFEDDPIQPWNLEVRQDLGAAAVMTIDKGTAASGKRSVKVEVTTPTGTAWHVKLRQDDRCFEKNDKFTLAFWCKAEKPRSVEASFQLQHDPWTVFFVQKFNVNAEWNEYSLTFTPSVDNFQDHWLAFQIADTNIIVWFDNVRYFLGEARDEEGQQVKKAVDLAGKLAATWAQIRSR